MESREQVCRDVNGVDLCIVVAYYYSAGELRAITYFKFVLVLLCILFVCCKRYLLLLEPTIV